MQRRNSPATLAARLVFFFFFSVFWRSFFFLGRLRFFLGGLLGPGGVFLFGLFLGRLLLSFFLFPGSSFFFWSLGFFGMVERNII